MGTSKGYLPPKGYLWSDSKRAVSSMISHNFENHSIGKAVARYLNATRHSSNGTNTNKQQIVSKVGAKTVGFINIVQSKGLNAALNEVGLQHLIGRSNEEVYLGLLEYFVGNGSSLDEAVVRDSMIELTTELFSEVTDGIDFEEILVKVDINVFIKDLITKFIQKDFIANFSEKIEGKCKNLDEYKSAEKSIKEFIKLQIDANYTIQELSRIDWIGIEGTNFINDKCNEVYKIYEVYLEG